MQWLEKFFSDKTTLVALLVSAGIGLAGAVPQGVIQKKHDGWSGFFSTIFIGMIVGVIVGLGIKDNVHSEAFRLAIVAAAAVISQDIWAGLRAIGRIFSEDPLGAVARFIAALRGQYVAPPTPAPPAPASAAPTATSSPPTLRPMPPPDSLGDK